MNYHDLDLMIPRPLVGPVRLRYSYIHMHTAEMTPWGTLSNVRLHLDYGTILSMYFFYLCLLSPARKMRLHRLQCCLQQVGRTLMNYQTIITGVKNQGEA